MSLKLTSKVGLFDDEEEEEAEKVVASSEPSEETAEKPEVEQLEVNSMF